MRFLNFFIFTLFVSILVAGCTSKPSENDGRQDVLRQIQTQSNGFIELTGFQKTNGTEMEFGGIKMYEMQWTANLVFKEDCLSDMQSFQALPIRPNCVGFECLANVGREKVRKGQRLNLSGSTTFRKTENGWQTASLELNQSATSTSSPVPPTLPVPPTPLGGVAVPVIQGMVTDLTSSLSSNERTVIEQQLSAFKERNGAEIAVLLVPTTLPETIEKYSLRVANTWRIGRAGINDGVLLMIAKEDRKVRISVGTGLENILDNDTVKQIIDQTIVPSLSRGDYDTAVALGVSAITTRIDSSRR